MNRKIRFTGSLALIGFSALLIGCGGPSVPISVKPNMTAAKEIRTKLASVTTVEKEEVKIEFGNVYATLKGTITLNGAPPANPQMNITKDLGVCKPGGATVLNEIVTVGNTGGLANVLVYADVPSEWCHETKINAEGEVEFDQKQCIFLNRIVGLQTSQTLKILNSDPVGHNAALSPAKNDPFNETIASNSSATYDPKKQEKSPFPVTCSVHPWMQSFLIFRDNGYFAVTKEDGSFEIENLPAGVPVKINVWHEATKGVPGKEVTVQPADVAQDWGRRGSFTVNLEPDSQAELQIAVNSSALSK